jgi:hypothetical protein
MLLIVSLPRNDLDLARAAAEAGADYVKVHMNVEHRASGTRFGTFAEEVDTVRSIMRGINKPVGLMPGADPGALPTNDELAQLHADGLAFVDIYTHHMPLRFLDLPTSLRLVVAFSHFRILQEYVDVPLIVPTQNAITPADAVWLARDGVAGLMIGAIVTGTTANSIAAATAAFRCAIDAA